MKELHNHQLQYTQQSAQQPTISAQQSEQLFNPVRQQSTQQATAICTADYKTINLSTPNKWLNNLPILPNNSHSTQPKLAQQYTPPL